MFDDVFKSCAVATTLAVGALVATTVLAAANQANPTAASQTADKEVPLVSSSAVPSVGTIDGLSSDNRRLDLLIEHYEKLDRLNQLRSGAGGSGETSKPEEEPANREHVTVDRPAESDRSNDSEKRQEAQPADLPLVSRVFGSNGRLYVDLIYRNGVSVPRAKTGTVLPGGETVKGISIDQVIVKTHDGERRLSFVPRHLGQ